MTEVIKPKLVKNKKVIRLNKSSTFLKTIGKLINTPEFKRGMFIFENENGEVGVAYRNCRIRDTAFLMRRIEHLEMREEIGIVEEVDV